MGGFTTIKFFSLTADLWTAEGAGIELTYAQGRVDTGVVLRLRRLRSG